MRIAPLAVCLAVCLLLAPATVVAKDKAADPVEEAIETLETDERVECAAALEVLALAGDLDRKEREALGVFGASTAHQKLTLRAAEILVAADADGVLDLFEKLRARFKKRSDRVARIARMTEKVPGDDAHKFLLDLSGHPNDVVAATAVRALAARGEEQSRPPLEALAKSTRPAVASAAAYALVQTAPDEGTRALLWNRVINGKADRIGDHCALALSTMPGIEDQADSALELVGKRARSDSFHGVVKLVLRTAKNPDPKDLIRLMRSKSEPVRETGCDLAGLTSCKDKTVQEFLVRVATTDQKWRVRVAAWLALRRTGAEHVVSSIASAIAKEGEESYWGLQVAIAAPHADYVEGARNAALDTKDPVRRDLAGKALDVLPDRESTRAFLLHVARTKAGSKRSETALLSLGNLKDANTFELMVQRLSEVKKDSQKLHVVKGLERMTGHFYEPDPEIWMDWYRVMDGDVAYKPKPIDRKANRERIKTESATGISPKTEAAVEAGLLWLSQHQDADGGWNGSTFHDHCPKGDCRAEGGHRDRDLAYTSLALLSFQGAGYSHMDGPYRDVIRRGFEYLMAHQDYDGSHIEKSWTFSYEAALMCQALSDGYALTGDEWIRPAAQRMIDYLVKVQHPGRTWRYSVRTGETDTSVMSWILMACVSARNAGLDIPEQIFVASEQWLIGATDPIPKDEWEIFDPALFSEDETYGVDISIDRFGEPRKYKIKTWYQPPRLYTPAMPAINILCRIWLGYTRSHPMMIGNANQVIDVVPGYGTGLEKDYAFYPYTWYYGSLAMFQMGGRYWNEWRDVCVKGVIDNQHTEGHLTGSWSMPREQFFGGLTGGRIYCTAMCILTLESFYRYQPYLARHSTRGSEEEDRPVKDDGKDGAGGDAKEE